MTNKVANMFMQIAINGKDMATLKAIKEDLCYVASKYEEEKA